MITPAYRATYEHRAELEDRAKHERCACGNDLLVAWYDGTHHLRCGMCGYDPQTEVRHSAGLRKRYLEGGADALDAIERQTLERQLRNAIRRAEAEGQPTPDRAILEQLEEEMTTGRSLVPMTETRAVMQRLTPTQVRQYFCPKATDVEVALFLQVCIATDSNPFLREAWIIKYDDREPAAIFLAKDRKLRAATEHPDYDGFKAGIITGFQDEILYRDSAFLPPGYTLLGGWAEVLHKHRSLPVRVEIGLGEGIKKTREGQPTRFWQPEHQPWMIRKVALSRALGEAFPVLAAATEIDEAPEHIVRDLPLEPVTIEEATGELLAATTGVLGAAEPALPDQGDAGSKEDETLANWRAALEGAATSQDLSHLTTDIAALKLTPEQFQTIRPAYDAARKRVERGGQ